MNQEIHSRTDRELILWAFPFLMDASNAAQLQMRRIQEDLLIDDKIPMRRWYDWQTLITQLWRMRKIALMMKRAESISDQITQFIHEFDLNIPKLKMCRDAIEHMDSYILKDENRHNKSINANGLMVGGFSKNEFSWMIDNEENTYILEDIMKSSWKFYSDIKDLKNKLKAKA